MAAPPPASAHAAAPHAGPGRRAPGATRAPRGACARRRVRARTAARSRPAPGSPRAPRPGAAPPLTRPALATCARAPLALPAPKAPGCPPQPLRDRPPAPPEPHTRPLARPQPPPMALCPVSPPRLLRSPRPRAQPHTPWSPGRAGELCRAAAAEAHYHRPARAAAVLKRRRQRYRGRRAPPSALPRTAVLGFSLARLPIPGPPQDCSWAGARSLPYPRGELAVTSQTPNVNNGDSTLCMLRGFQNILKPRAHLTHNL